MRGNLLKVRYEQGAWLEGIVIGSNLSRLCISSFSGQIVVMREWFAMMFKRISN